MMTRLNGWAAPVALLLFLGIFPSPADAQGGAANRPGSFSISTNPVKLVEGLLNLEVDVSLHELVSLHLFSEYLLFDYAINRSVHPDLVVRAGPRIHVLGANADRYDPFVGIWIGQTWSRDYAANTAFDVGAEGGLRWLFYDSLFLGLKGLLTYPIGSSLLPGFEVQVGLILP